MGQTLGHRHSRPGEQGEPLRTIRTRPSGDLTPLLPPLRAMAELYGQVERRLFAVIMRGEAPERQKPMCLARFGLTSRQFNAIVRSLRGKIAGAREHRRHVIDGLHTRIKRAKTVIEQLTKELAAAGRSKPSQNRVKRRRIIRPRPRRSASDLRNQLHQKRRRLTKLEWTLARLQADERAGRVRICFGGRKLFRAQFHLEENAYATHADWLQVWRAARSNQIVALGSLDEHAGCQSCVARKEPDGSYTLQLRLPEALVQTYGEHLTIPGIRFAYGQQWFEQALAASHLITRTSRTGRTTRSYTGVPISYRFVLDQKGVEIFATMPIRIPKPVTTTEHGAIGLDLNADHLAMTETDANGNLVKTKKIPLELEGCTRHQALARIGDAVKQVIALGTGTGKPIMSENLDFAKKKAALEGRSKRYKRMLSRFCSRAVVGTLTARAEEAGIEVKPPVEPAFTSVIGRYKYAKRYGLSVHQAAALVIARRGLGYSERCPSASRKGDPISQWQYESGTWAVPARKRSQHVGAYWRTVLRRDARWRSRRRRDTISPVGARSGTAPALVFQGAACAGPIRQRGSPLRGRSRPRAASTVRAATVRNIVREDHGRRNTLL